MDKYQLQVLMMLSSFDYQSFDCVKNENSFNIYFDLYQNLEIPFDTIYSEELRGWCSEGSTFNISRDSLIDVFDLNEQVMVINDNLNSGQSSILGNVCECKTCYRAVYCKNFRTHQTTKEFGLEKHGVLIDDEKCKNEGFANFEPVEYIIDTNFFWNTINRYAHTNSIALAYGHLKPYAFQLEKEKIELQLKIKQLEEDLFKIQNGVI